MSSKLAQSARPVSGYSIHRATPAPFAATSWIPRVVRCVRCTELAREELRERLTDEEVAVRYVCANCRSHQTRHYIEVEQGV